MNAPFFTIIAFSPLFGSTTILDPAGSPHNAHYRTIVRVLSYIH